MNLTVDSQTLEPTVRAPRDWVRILANYREPDQFRSFFELTVTLVPFLLLWGLAWWAMSISYVLTFAISVLNAGFLLRLFIIQHDCGHGAFLKSRIASDWLGRFLGILTVTPYTVWRQTHAVHHNGSGNLDRRGMGDIYTMTVSEYRSLNWAWRLQYRVYRHPLFVFGLVPSYVFLIQNRIPFGLASSLKYWLSAMYTNAAIFAVLGTIVYFGGLMPVLLIFLPSTVVAATLGIWLFYVQHQFEEAHWNHEDDWQLHEAALHGSSHYVMPKVLNWFSGNIGIHHVHHLYSRIPFYRLPEVLRDHIELAEGKKLTIRESIACARLHLWDEDSRRLLPFRQERAQRP